MMPSYSVTEFNIRIDGGLNAWHKRNAGPTLASQLWHLGFGIQLGIWANQMKAVVKRIEGTKFWLSI
jgi:hypothetical protein